MDYLIVECSVCGYYWDYYEEKPDFYPNQTSMKIVECVCPRCGNLGFIPSIHIGQQKEA